MDEFSYIFELFALLLGLAVAEMLGGFGQVLKLRARRKAGVGEYAIPASSSGCAAQPEAEPVGRQIRIGWLTPLLGLLVTIDLATFWNLLWLARGALEVNFLTVFVVLALIGGYYLVATQVFPDEPQLWPDFDAWYKLQKRFVVLGVVTINLLAQGAILALGAMPALTPAQVAASPALGVASVLVALTIPLLLWLAFSKRERVDAALIVVIVASHFFYAGGVGGWRGWSRWRA